MAISINDVNSSQINTATQSKQVSGNGKETHIESQKELTQKSTDTVTFTESAKLIQDLEKQIKSIPVVDSDRVAKVRENLNSGNYNISSDNLKILCLQS